MIQSGTGQFENLKIRLGVPPLTFSQKIIFPKPYSNPPIVVLSILGTNLNFSAYSSYDSHFNVISHGIIYYDLESTQISSDEFMVNLTVEPSPAPNLKGTNVFINGKVIKYSWIAYNEVTIGA